MYIYQIFTKHSSIRITVGYNKKKITLIMQFKQGRGSLFLSCERSPEVHSLELVRKTQAPPSVISLSSLPSQHNHGCCSSSHYIHVPSSRKEDEPRAEGHAFLKE